jgi:hypothetical protein
MNREAIAHYLPLSVFLRVLGASAFRLEAEIETRRRRGRREERGDSFRLVWVRIPNRWGTNVHLLPLSVFLRVLGASAFQFLCLPLARNRLEACFPRQAGSLSYGSSSHRHLNEVHSCSTGKSSEPNWSRAECPDHRWRGHSARRLSPAKIIGFLQGFWQCPVYYPAAGPGIPTRQPELAGSAHGATTTIMAKRTRSPIQS